MAPLSSSGGEGEDQFTHLMPLFGVVILVVSAARRV